MGAVDGTRTRDLRLDGPDYHSLSSDGTVRALGLEPSLLRGKNPMPYQSGVTRKVGRDGMKPRVSKDGWSATSCALGRGRPNSGARWH